MMDHRDYIGRPLKDLVSVLRDYEVNFYQVFHGGRFHLKDHLGDETVMSRRIKSISHLYPDYHYDINLE
jgi:hypothetical protein